ncbi:MAG TPA: SDR family oxidoreductase, partial [Candidatus Binatia bacterium]|nr:SDR family oxidoreductase [Candidatus Binatia bacterium]
MKILVTGGSGMLGYDLMRRASRQHEVWGSYHTRHVRLAGCGMISLDLAREDGIKANVMSIRPEVFVHTAALTDVDECEREPERARKINSEGTAVLAEIAEQIGARFVYISTDYVFDGVKGDYSEEDSPRPVNSYGATKLAGEEAVRQRCANALILRTSIFGLKIPPKTGLMELLVNSLRDGQKITRFADQFATPIYTGQLSGL